MHVYVGFKKTTNRMAGTQAFFTIAFLFAFLLPEKRKDETGTKSYISGEENAIEADPLLDSGHHQE